MRFRNNRSGIDFWKILEGDEGEGNGTPTPVLLPGKSHKLRSLVGCGPWGLDKSDTTERFHFHFSLSCIGEGSGNPLQCSCLENPRDGGAWWAAVYGFTQSWTRLKWLSSSNRRWTYRSYLTHKLTLACVFLFLVWTGCWDLKGRRFYTKRPDF